MLLVILYPIGIFKIKLKNPNWQISQICLKGQPNDVNYVKRVWSELWHIWWNDLKGECYMTSLSGDRLTGSNTNEHTHNTPTLDRDKRYIPWFLYSFHRKHSNAWTKHNISFNDNTTKLLHVHEVQWARVNHPFRERCICWPWSYQFNRWLRRLYNSKHGGE